MIKTLLIYFVNLSFISLLLILLFDSFLMPKYVRMGTGKYMVNVIEKNLDYGRKVLESEGYKIIVSDTLFTSSYDPGIIIDQYPKPNTRVKEGRTIRLKISQPEKTVPIPDLIGRSLRSAGLSKKKAVEDLQKAGFKLGKIFYRQNEDLIPYTVLNQSITAETVLEKPVPIDLTVSVLDMQDIFNQMINQ